MLSEVIKKLNSSLPDGYYTCMDNLASANANMAVLLEDNKATHCAMLIEDLCTRDYAAETTTMVINVTDKITMYFFTFVKDSDVPDIKLTEREKIVTVIDKNVIPIFLNPQTTRATGTSQITFPHAVFDDNEVGVQLVFTIVERRDCEPSPFDIATQNMRWL